MSVRCLFVVAALLVSVGAQAADLVCAETGRSGQDDARLTLRYVDDRLSYVSLQTVHYTTPELDYPCDISASVANGESTWTYRKNVAEVTFTEPFVDDSRRFPKVFVTSSANAIVVTHDVPFYRFCGNQAYLPAKVTFIKKSGKCIFK